MTTESTRPTNNFIDDLFNAVTALEKHNVNTPPPPPTVSFLDELHAHEATTLAFKAKEYSDGSNRYLNFEEVGVLADLPREAVCLTYLLKHIQSISLAIRSDNIKWYWIDENGNEGLKNRIVDARNYLALLGEIIDNNLKRNKEESVNALDSNEG